MTTSARLAVLIAAVVIVATVLFSFRLTSTAADFSRRVHEIAGGSFEASGVAHVPGTDGVLFVDDAEPGRIFWMELAADGSQKGPSRAVSLGTGVTDPEGITTDGARFYVVASLSKSAESGTAGLVSFTFDPRTLRAEQVQSVRDLHGFLADHVDELRGTRGRVGEDILNIEGLAWDPRDRRLLLGLKAPVIDGAALIVPLSLRDRSGPLTRENLQVDRGGPVKVATDGGGVRSLEYDARAEAFRVIVDAKSGTSEWRLLEWEGPSGSGAIRQLMTFPGRLKPEGITRGEISDRPVTVVVFDTGQYAVLD